MNNINSTTKTVLNILLDGEFHNGTSIGKKLNISRAAIWKHIKQLQSIGIELDSIKGKGYRIKTPISLLDKNNINTLINQKFDNATLHVSDQTDSTNLFLKELECEATYSFCTTEQQTSGKGRFDRAWYSPFGQNIYLSMKYRSSQDISQLSGLSLVIAVAIIHMLEKLNIQAEIKWPNDILYQGKKLAGILIEVNAQPNTMTNMIIGIGLNVNMLQDNESIDSSWTSLALIKNQQFDRNQLIGMLCDELSSVINEFENSGLQSFLDTYQKHHCLKNKEISLQAGKMKYKGKVVGISNQGHLTLKLEDGSIKNFSSGEVTIDKNRS